jgi:hypothetical protein
VHDFNGGIQPSGLFWVVELPPGAVNVFGDGRNATMHASNVPVVDSFQFGGPINVPAAVSFSIEWHADGPFVARGKGTAVPPTDPAAFLGAFARAGARGTFSGREFGFSFKSDPGVSSRGGYALLGRERNGVFLQGG